jgi:hypothetical protein
MIRKSWLLVGAAALVAALAAVGIATMSGANDAVAAAQGPPVSTATVDRGTLADMVSSYGTLSYRARSDGSPYTVFNQARGTYTQLPNVGDRVACGDVLYRVNSKPVLLLCGATPAYRALFRGENGPDVAELNTNLVQLGYATRTQLDPTSAAFTSETVSALKKLQSSLGEDRTGSLDLGQVVFLPESVRVAAVTGQPGGSAQPGAPVLDATSDTPEVELPLDPSQQDDVQAGDPAQIILPGNRTVAGKVNRLGRVAQIPAGQNNAGQNNGAGDATIPAYITLDHPQQADGLDQAPVQVEITTRGVKNTLSVPVTAIVGRSGGGFAVEVIGVGDRRRLVAVKLGLYDTAGGRVQVDGALRAGERVVVGSS